MPKPRQVERRQVERLKPLQVERAKSRVKPYKLSDGKGLHLHVSTSGTRSWRYSFRFGGRAQLLTLGQYPEISLKRARQKHEDARRELEEGRNPCVLKAQVEHAKKSPESGSFKAIAEEWYSSLKDQRSHSWQDNVRRWLNQRIYPEIGKKAVKDVQAADVLAILKSMDREGKPRSAESVRQLVSQVFDHAILNLWATFNPAQSLAGAVKPAPHKPHPHLSERDLAAFLKKLDAFPDKTMRNAVNLLLLTATRKSELLGAKWNEINLDLREWRVPAERMKSRREHIVPLSDQALECFKELQNGSEYVFPSPMKPRQAMTKNGLDATFKDLGGISPHGVRSTFSTIANERSGLPGDVIEAALAHVERDQVRRAYNRAQWLEQRAKLLQWWGDYLGSARHGNVVQLPARVA